MKKLFIIIGIMLIAAMAGLALVACSGGSGGEGDDIYYEVKGYGSSATLNESSWIKLKDGKWSDDDGESGTYKLDGNKITILQDGEELMSGTLQDGVITLSLLGVPVGVYSTKDAFTAYAGKSSDGSSAANENSIVGEDPGTGIISEAEDDSAKVKSITGGEVSGMSISYEVGEDIEFVDLSGMLTVSKKSSWQLYEDMMGQKLIPTKYAAGLRPGNNVYYIVVNSSDDKVNRTYALNIWKNYRVTISYYVLGTLYDTESVLTHIYLKDHAAASVPGYTFNGWRCAGTYVNDRGLSFEAFLTANTYVATLNAADGTMPSDAATTKEVTYDAPFSFLVPTRTGYTFAGWYLGSTQITTENGASLSPWRYAENKTISAKWTANSYTVTTNVSDVSAGTVSGDGNHDFASSVTLRAATNAGYTFLGWYDGETKVSDGENLTFTFTMPAENKTYTAKWEYARYTITYHLDEGINASGNPTTFTMNDEITLLSPVKRWYSFEGWYKESSFTNRITTISVGTTSDVDVYAKWQEADASVTYFLDGGINAAANPKTYTREQVGKTVDLVDPTKIAKEEITDATTLGNGQYSVTKDVTAYAFLGWYTEASFVHQVTTITLSDDAIMLYAKWSATTSTTTTEQSYLREGNYIYFGEYPQTIKAADVTITNTTDSRGYYLGSDGEYYAKVTASPNDSGYTFSTGASVTSGTVYYFKVEPIKWRILEESNGEAFIVCDSIIANHRYAASSNNYAGSEIRAWLNDSFYNTAFGDLQKQLIVLTTVNNSARSTNPNNNATAFNSSGTNPYACANTEDYVFLLSEQEVTTNYGTVGFNTSYTAYDTTRRMQTSDYSRATGAYMSTSSDYYGSGIWWLRSPYFISSYYAYYVYYYGSAGGGKHADLHWTYFGVVPALRIKL